MLNFSMSELTHSDTAVNQNIKNIPDLRQMDSLLNLIVGCLQPCRELLGKPMIVTSGFRNKQVNLAVGGSKTSQHIKGEACDFVVDGLSVQEAFDKIKNSNIIYDQLINEYDKWIHISYKKGINRRQAFKV